MAIAVTTPASGKFGWIINATSADASATEELLAAPAAGIRTLVKHITINSGAAISVTIGEGETGGAVTTAILGPILFAANTSMQWDFPAGIVLTAATSLTVDASGAGAVCIFAHGEYVT